MNSIFFWYFFQLIIIAFFEYLIDYYFFLQVLNPKGTYKGQVPIKLVITKTPPKATNIPPNVPETTPVK